MTRRQARRRVGTQLGLATGLFLLGAVSATAQVDAADAEEVKPKKWEATAAAGLTLTSGNSDTFLATITANASRKWARDEILMGAGFGYGETKTDGIKTKNQDYLMGFFQYNHLFTDRLYGAARIDGLHDDLANVNYRFTISPNVGYFIIKKEKTFLTVEAGPSLVIEEVGGIDRSYWGLRFADRFEHQLTETTRIWQYAEYIPQVDNFNNYLINLEVGISTKITKALDLRVVLIDNYNNQPAKDRRKNDLKLIAGVGYTF